jgi:phosphoglycolate phosphatase
LTKKALDNIINGVNFMKYSGIIFDLDGTLLDTLEDLADSVNSVLKSYGFPTHKTSDYKLKVGMGFKNLLINSFPPGTEFIDEATDAFVKTYALNYANKTKPYAGIPETLRELQKKNIAMGVDSNKRDSYTARLIEKFFGPNFFSLVVGEREDLPKKPNPAGAELILKSMRLSKKDVLFIGDSLPDIQTAQNAGLDSAGVLWGFRGAEELKNAKYLFSEPREILSLF